MAQQTKDRVLGGRYRVLERLGSGGMAAVYLALDERLGRRVAIKSLHAHGPDDSARRLTREAKLLASLNHPNVVSVFDTQADAESVLIVMEYVEGETLGNALRRGPLEHGRAAGIVTAVAAALDHAHEHGVVHRDVKPDNVLLGERGDVKLADLGIARAVEGTQVTRTGTVLGTPSYMAPEQLEGGEVTPAVDVYALAAVAWETLAGRKARPGRTPVEIAHRVASEPPPDLREAWPDAPPAAADLLRRAMDRDPAVRPASAGALARELTAALKGEATAATRPLAVSQPPDRARRPFGAWLIPALLVAVAGLAIALAAGGGDEAPEREAGAPAQPETRDEGSQRDEPAAAAPQEEQPAAEDRVAEGLRLESEGHTHMQAGRYEQAVESSRRAVELLDGSGRIEYWYALYNLGRSLRLAGRPEEAIPVLEQRLQYPDQRDEVERELELAREAVNGGDGDEGKGDEGRGRGNDKGRGKKDD